MMLWSEDAQGRHWWIVIVDCRWLHDCVSQYDYVHEMLEYQMHHVLVGLVLGGVLVQAPPEVVAPPVSLVQDVQVGG